MTVNVPIVRCDLCVITPGSGIAAGWYVRVRVPSQYQGSREGGLGTTGQSQYYELSIPDLNE